MADTPDPKAPARVPADDADDAVRLPAIVARKRADGICIEPGCDDLAFANEHCIRHNGGIR